MTPADRARASRTAQGLPPAVRDVATLRRVAALVATVTPRCVDCPDRVAA